MIRSVLTLVGASLLLLAAMAAKNFLIVLPASPVTPTADAFDANRAATRLARILGDERAHPVDSDANDAVRDRLIAELRTLGLQPRVTDDFACNGFERSRTVSCARVRNVVATMGPAEGRHLLLSAHYDSTFAGPGAADAGIGIASLLETAALLRNRPLARPVTFLFNEGEEMGLIGARAFLERDPVAPQVDTLINLEARGVEGPAIMFETSRPNAAAVNLYARAVSRPVANSLTTDLYGLVPNSTDVTVFAGRSWTILNFAIIGNETRYHTAGDDMAALDRRSLQHMGTQTLDVAREVAGREAIAAEAGTRIYADVVGRLLATRSLPVALLMFVAFTGLLLFSTWERRALGRPLIVVTLSLVAATLLAWAAHGLIGLSREGDFWRGHPGVTASAVYACAIAMGLILLGTLARGIEARRLRPAFWLLFMLVGAGIVIAAPGAVVFFLAAPAAAGVTMAASDWRRWLEPVGAVVAILLLYLSFGPALGLFEELMSNGPHWMFAPLGGLMLLPVLIELQPWIARARKAHLVTLAALLVLGSWAMVALAPAYSEDRQQMFTIDYVWDADARDARWAVTNDGAAVPYEADWQRAELRHSTRRRWVASAPALPVSAPAIALVGELRGEGRRVRLRLASNGAETISLIAPAGSDLRVAGAAGFFQPFGPGDADDRFTLRCVGRSCDGAMLDIVSGRPGPIELLVVGTRSGLPREAASLVRARPAFARPQYAPDSTIAYAKVRL